MAEEVGLELCLTAKEKPYTQKGNWVKEQTAQFGYNIRCDIVIHNKKYIFGRCPIPSTELLKTLEFSK